MPGADRARGRGGRRPPDSQVLSAGLGAAFRAPISPHREVSRKVFLHLVVSPWKRIFRHREASRRQDRGGGGGVCASSCRPSPRPAVWPRRGSPRAQAEMEAGRCRDPARKRRPGAHGAFWPDLGWGHAAPLPRATQRLVCPEGRGSQARLVARTVRASAQAHFPKNLWIRGNSQPGQGDRGTGGHARSRQRMVSEAQGRGLPLQPRPGLFTWRPAEMSP